MRRSDRSRRPPAPGARERRPCPARRGPGRPEPERVDSATSGAAVLEGRNPVLEALRAARPLHRLYVAREAREGSVREIVSRAREAGVTVVEVDRERLDQMSQTGRHQGVIAHAAAKGYADLDECLAAARSRGEPPLLLLCDGIEDPHNLGAILRVADAAGAHGVIIGEHRSVGLTAAVGRSSAGAIEHVRVVRVTNVTRTADALKQAGVWIVGAHQSAGVAHFEADLAGPVALVIGGEGRGIGPNLRNHCDLLLRIPMHGGVNSLNASVAAAVLLYEIVRQRRGGAPLRPPPPTEAGT